LLQENITQSSLLGSRRQIASLVSAFYEYLAELAHRCMMMIRVQGT